jgi:hypothetical protein
MFILDGKPLSPDVAFTDPQTGVQYPANFLRLSTPEEREAIGITEVPDPQPYDQRFYWGYDADGNLIPKDHSQLVEQWTQQTRTTAGTLITPTDWMVIREQDNGVAVDPEIKGWREDLRLASELKISGIVTTATTEELAAFVASPEYSSWPPDPRLPAPVPPEPVTPEPVSGDVSDEPQLAANLSDLEGEQSDVP